MGMTNLEWLYEHDEYLNSFAKLMACLRGFATDEFTANEWLRQEHSEPNPDCSAMLYRMFTENMKHEPCSHYEPNPEGDALGWLRKWIAGHDPQLRGHGLAGLETIADMIERDYVRRESVEEVMDNDRVLVEENSVLARELLKLRAELEKATNNLNSANEDFENARAELTAERDELQSKLAEYEDRSMQYVSLTGGKLYTGTKALTERIAELTAELDAAKQQISQFDAPKSVETSENPASKCEIRDFDDSREQLEADVRKHYSHTTSTLMYPPSANKQTDWLASMSMDTVFGWLDRQAAITAEETSGAWEEYRDATQREIMELTAECDKLRSQICKLEDDLVRTSYERDNWKANCEDWKKHARAAENACYETMLEREHYRSKFSRALGYADDIHALMDDEGMA